MRFKLVIDQGFHFTTVEQGTTTEVHVPADTTRLAPRSDAQYSEFRDSWYDLLDSA